MKIIPRYTLGIGDRFGMEGEAQLSAVMAAARLGAPVHPVWNKSHREHTITGTQPPSLRAEADAAVAALGWTGPYFVDADHINLRTVDAFAACSDFFTIDVADFVGQPAEAGDMQSFLARRADLAGAHDLAGLVEPLQVTADDLQRTARKFLRAVQEAGRIHRRIAELRPDGDFALEVSIDETDTPQSPAELLIILAMIADEGIPAQTVAPKFTGRFNKGVDYVGELPAFEREFDADLAVLAHAVKSFGLPDSLKVSVHSGSDKFSLYPVIRQLLVKHGAGLHLKTAGTTWLEEVIGLAEAGGDGLDLAKEIYTTALPMAADLIAPYAQVVDISVEKLPSAGEVATWTSEQFVSALNHDQSCPGYQPQFRQFLHVSFKVAAKMGPRFSQALRDHRKVIAGRVTSNLLDKHLRPIFFCEE